MRGAAVGCRSVTGPRFRFGVQNYKRIMAWRKAHALLINVHREIRHFPREYGSLKAQLRRSAESIASNIVEGAAKESQRSSLDT